VLEHDRIETALQTAHNTSSRNTQADISMYGATTPTTDTRGGCGVDSSGSGQGTVVSCCGHSN